VYDQEHGRKYNTWAELHIQPVGVEQALQAERSQLSVGDPQGDQFQPVPEHKIYEKELR